jgi:hypothetical protein
MSTSLSDSGVVLASGNLIDLKTAMPSTGSYTAGDIVLESTTGVRISGWKRLTTGSSHVLNTDWAYFTASQTLGTAVATTSGTSIDFTGIPSWVKRITVMFNSVSNTGSVNPNSSLLIQIGSGSIDSAGYLGASMALLSGSSAAGEQNSNGFRLTASATSAAFTYSGNIVLCTSGSNIWTESGILGHDSASVRIEWSGGRKNLSGVLDRVRITTVNGTDTFDAGSVNILYE